MDQRLRKAFEKGRRPETQEVLDLPTALAHHASHFLLTSGGLGKYNLEHLEKSKNILEQIEKKATDNALRTKVEELREKFNEVRPEEPVNEELLDQIQKLRRDVELVSHELRTQ